MAGAVDMLLVLGGCLVTGVPIVWLTTGRRPLDEAGWLLAPFLGLAGLIVLLYNLVLLDCPIARAMPWVWALAGAGWFALLSARTAEGQRVAPWQAASTWRTSMAAFPWRVYAVAAGVFCLQGLGLFIVGPRDYMARAKHDQFGYVSAAQFLMDVPFSTTWAEVGQRASLVEALLQKTDRLGVEMVQGFFAATGGKSAKELFVPTILLGPALLVPAMYLVCRRLGRGPRPALAPGVGAGLLPALTTLQLDCFMSQSVSVPFLLVVLLALHELTVEPSRGRFATAVLLFAAMLALYGEMTLILAGLMAVCAVGGLVLRAARPAGLLWLAAVPVAAVAINPLYSPVLWSLLSARAFAPTAGSHPFDFAYNRNGLTCLWVNEYWAYRGSFTGSAAFLLGLMLTGLAILGCVYLAARSLRAARPAATPEDRRSGLLALALLAFASVPLALLAYSRQHPYQFCKLMISVSPVLVLGVCHAWEWLPAAVWRRRLGAISVGLAVATAVIGTTRLSYAATRADRPQSRSLQHITLDPAWRDALNRLSELRGENVVLATGAGIHHNGWFIYAARQNNVWLVNHALTEMSIISGTPVGARSIPISDGLEYHPDVRQFRFSRVPQLVDLHSLPASGLLLTSDLDGCQVQVEGAHSLIWDNGHFQLWRLGPGPYTLHPTEAARAVK